MIIYSHGFGVRKDARGIFTAIEEALPDAEHAMFDYNEVDPVKNRIRVPSIAKQTEQLQQKINEIKQRYPGATLHLVGHSLGCVVAGLANVDGIESIVLLAPPIDLKNAEKRMRNRLFARLRINWRGEIKVKRRDGVTLVITHDYRKSRHGINPVELYNRLAQRAKVVVIGASDDKLLGRLDFSGLAKNIRTLVLKADHNFSNDARDKVVAEVVGILR